MLLCMERTFEYRLRPNTTQEAALCTVLKASCQLYNDALAEWKAHFEATGQYLSLYEQDKHYNKTTYPDVPAGGHGSSHETPPSGAHSLF